MPSRILAHGMKTFLKSRAAMVLWVLPGAALMVCMAALAALSARFAYGTEWESRPILTVAALLMAAALPYFAACLLAWRTRPSGRGWWLWMLGAGLAMRLVLFASTPVMEDDFYRYLWDGGLAAHGHNPYRYVPEAVIAGGAEIPDSVEGLGKEGGTALTRTNHPHLGTIYPPVAEAAFAVAHVLVPWQILGLRMVWLALDVAALVFLGMALRALNRPASLLVVYWWNPLLLKEVYNSVHMEAVLLPLLALVLLCTCRGRHLRALTALAGAVGVKFWPLLLASVLWWPLRQTARLALGGAVLFIVLLAALLSPMLPVVDLGHDSGLVAYSERWEMNDALFMVFTRGAHACGTAMGFAMNFEREQMTARLVVLAFLGMLAVWTTLKRSDTPDGRARGMLLLTATLFLLSPTQFPWYFLWLLPFLTAFPRPSLLSLTALLPLYYVRFYCQHVLGNAGYFHYGIVWVEYAPVWGLIIAEGIVAWRRRSIEAVAPLEPTGD